MVREGERYKAKEIERHSREKSCKREIKIEEKSKRVTKIENQIE